MRKLIFSTLAAFAFASLAMADTLVFNVAGDNPGETNTAQVTFTYDPQTGTVGVTILNTSPEQNGIGTPSPGPQISGFTFNTPSNVTGVTSFTGPSEWVFNFTDGGINAPDGVGVYDVCAETQGGGGNNCNGGGATDPRLLPGESGDFQFVLAGTDLEFLIAKSFLDIINPGTNGDPRASYFSVRFQQTGLDGQGSDVGTPLGPPRPPNQVIPEPSSMMLLGTSITGVLLLIRRRRAA